MSYSYIIKNKHGFAGLIVSLLLVLPFVSRSQDVMFPDDTIEGIHTNAPVLENRELILHSKDGTEFVWAGPNNFSSTSKYIRISGVDTTYRGTYYLTVTDSIRDTTLYFSAYVEVIPLPPSCGINNENPDICEYSNFELECTLQGYQYDWSSNTAGNIIFSLPVTTYVPTVTLYAGQANYGVYPISVVVKDQNGTPVGQCTTWVNIMDCCLPVVNPQWVTVLNNTTISSFTGSFTEPTIIKGDLIIDVDYDIIGDQNFHTIRVLEGGSIIVEENIEFKMDGINVTGCNRLWQNLLVLQNASLELYNDTFSLAWKAVKVMLQPGESATLVLRSNYFVDNKVGISLEKGIPLISLSANTFTSESTIGLNYDHRYGIQVYLCSSVEISGAEINEFSDLQWGILSVGSNLLVRKDAAFFVDMTSKPGPGNLNYGGVGLAKSNVESAVVVIEKEGNGSNKPVDFENCKWAIGISDANLIVTNNRITDCLFGIMATNCQGSTSFVIEDNEINCHYTGIELTQNDLVSSMYIHGNTIELEEVNGRTCRSCIAIYEDGNVTKNSLHEISHNVLNVDEGLYGIEMNGVLGVHVMENTINLPEPYVNLVGILLQNCSYDTVQCNYITGADPAEGNSTTRTPYGILAAETQYTRYLFNYIYDTYTGIGFQEDCYNSDIQRNQFHEHHTGLFYNPYAQTSPQERKANAWNDACSNYKAENLNQVFQGSYYTYGYNCTPCDPNPSVYPSPGWFFYDQYFNTPDVEPPCAGLSMMAAQVGDSLLDALDYAIAQNEVVFPDYQEELMWHLDRRLFNKLDDNPALTSNNPVMSDYYQATQYASPGLFEALRKQARQAMLIPSTVTESYHSLKAEFLSLRSDLSSLDSLLFASPEPEDSLVYLALRETLRQEIMSNQYQLAALLKSQQDQIPQLTDPILENNGALPDTSLVESNEILVNSIYYSTIARGIFEFSAAQSGALLNVASMCPLAGGNAVYRARSMYTLVYDTVFNDWDICLEAGYVKSSMHKPRFNPENNIRFTITPNPNAGECRLSWTGKSDEAFSLQITDLLGRVVYTRDFSPEAGELSLNLRSLPQGVYMAVVKGKNIYRKAGRLILTK